MLLATLCCLGDGSLESGGALHDEDSRDERNPRAASSSSSPFDRSVRRFRFQSLKSRILLACMTGR